MNPNCIRPDENLAQERRNSARRQLDIPQDAIVAITVGANLKLKGADRVIQAINTLNQERATSKLHLLLVGKLPADLQQLAAQSHEIHALGLRQDIPDLLLAADIMLHPARQEAAGSVLIEAIASGIPVICSDVCGFKDHVLSTSNLVTSEPFSQEQFVQLTRTALDNLPQFTQTTRNYATKNDFNARSDQMLKLMADGQ
jgi:UDP-glucose:(heptosyl)LPS alpha-1,3-glucosyltransferase